MMRMSWMRMNKSWNHEQQIKTNSQTQSLIKFIIKSEIWFKIDHHHHHTHLKEFNRLFFFFFFLPNKKKKEREWEIDERWEDREPPIEKGKSCQIIKFQTEDKKKVRVGSWSSFKTCDQIWDRYSKSMTGWWRRPGGCVWEGDGKLTSNLINQTASRILKHTFHPNPTHDSTDSNQSWNHVFQM